MSIGITYLQSISKSNPFSPAHFFMAAETSYLFWSHRREYAFVSPKPFTAKYLSSSHQCIFPTICACDLLLKMDFKIYVAHSFKSKQF